MLGVLMGSVTAVTDPMRLTAASRVALPLRNVCMTNFTLLCFFGFPKKWHITPPEREVF